MTQESKRIYLNGSTYVTKENGKLVMIRPRREKLLDICMDLLGEAFGKYSRPKMKEDTEKPEGETVLPEGSATRHFESFPTPPLFSPNANLMGPPPTQSMTVPMIPQPGVYRFGNRQLALMPINPQLGPAMPPQIGYPYSQPQWMYPQAPNIGGFNYPPMGTDPRQFITNSATNSEAASQSPATVTKHICAECGRLRSRKYQEEHPLKPGESPTLAFCRRCPKDVTSTEDSESSVENTKKQHKKAKKGSKVSSIQKPKAKIPIAPYFQAPCLPDLFNRRKEKGKVIPTHLAQINH
jgi:hypothetical protein